MPRNLSANARPESFRTLIETDGDMPSGANSGVPSIVSGILLATIIGLSGCGTKESSDQPSKGSSGSVRAAPWSVTQIRDRDMVVLSVLVGYCAGERAPVVDRAQVDEGSRSTRITVFVEYPLPDRKVESCPDIGLGLPKTVELDQPIEGRALYDGSRSPPHKRWPLGRSQQ